MPQYCSQCGTELGAEAKFCSHCGFVAKNVGAPSENLEHVDSSPNGKTGSFVPPNASTLKKAVTYVGIAWASWWFGAQLAQVFRRPPAITVGLAGAGMAALAILAENRNLARAKAGKLSGRQLRWVNAPLGWTLLIPVAVTVLVVSVVPMWSANPFGLGAKIAVGNSFDQATFTVDGTPTAPGRNYAVLKTPGPFSVTHLTVRVEQQAGQGWRPLLERELSVDPQDNGEEVWFVLINGGEYRVEFLSGNNVLGAKTFRASSENTSFQ